MKKYGVNLPISGIVYVEVEANSEEEAIQIAFEKDLTTDMISEWEAHEQICQGNVLYAIQNEADAQEI